MYICMDDAIGNSMAATHYNALNALPVNAFNSMPPNVNQQ